MNRKEIIETLNMLAKSNGRYGRFLQSMYELQEEDPDRCNEIWEYFESQDLLSPVDLIFFLDVFC